MEVPLKLRNGVFEITDSYTNEAGQQNLHSDCRDSLELVQETNEENNTVSTFAAKTLSSQLSK